MSAGIITKVQGKAFALRNGNKLQLNTNDSVEADDKLLTEPNSALEVKFADDSVINLGADTEVELADFVMGEAPSFVLQMAGGIMQSVSGKIVEQNPTAFSIRTPLGTVGIRGTTTLHIIDSSGAETHALVDISPGHTVVIQAQNGQSVLLTSDSQAVELLQGLSPQIFMLDPTTMQTLVQELLNGTDTQDTTQSLEKAIKSIQETLREIEPALVDNLALTSDNGDNVEKGVSLSTDLSLNDLLTEVELVNMEKDSLFSELAPQLIGKSPVADNKPNLDQAPLLPEPETRPETKPKIPIPLAQETLFILAETLILKVQKLTTPSACK